MKLVKLKENNCETIRKKNIYCCEKNVGYLREMQKKIGVIDNIIGIFDDNIRNQGLFEYSGKEFNVYGFEQIEKIEWTDSDALLITSDYYNEVYDKLCNMPAIYDNIAEIYYYVNLETEYEEIYRTRYENNELQNIIVFRSGPHATSYVNGMDFSDNARALFEYMLSQGYNKKYELVWIVKQPEDFTHPEGRYYRYTRDYDNISYVGYDWAVSDNDLKRDEYYRALCLAKYLFFTDAYGFARNCRKDQMRIQLWHGCGFKTRVNFDRCEKRYEYTTVISDLYSNIHQKIYGLRENQMLVTGYAKQDWLFSPIENFTDRLPLPNASKYIFWLPTFRMAKEDLSNLNEYEYDNQIGLPIVDNVQKLQEVNELLKTNDIVIILKLHPFQDKSKIANINLSNVVMLENDVLVKGDIHINQLLGHSDALISDYSSVAVDYMLLDKPIAFTLDDVDEYSDSRGFVFDNIREWLPGKEIYSFDNFCEFIQEVSDGVDETQDKRQRLTDKMHKFKDNQSCKRIVDVLGL